MRLLIVEDDNDISSYVARGLGQIGYSADVVENAEEAVLVLEHTNYMLFLRYRFLILQKNATLIYPVPLTVLLQFSSSTNVLQLKIT